MKVERIQLYHIDLRKRPPHHQLFAIRLCTDDGLCGVGEIAMPYGVGGESVLAAARAVGERFVLGCDPARPEALWQSVFRGSYWGLGHSLALYGAMAGFDLACWDIKGKSVGRPLHDLLGGRVRDSLDLYANHWYGDAKTPEEFAAKAAAAVAAGWRGLKFDPFREHAGRTQAAAVQLDPAAGKRGVARAKAVREAIGPDVRLYFDLHGALAPDDAVRWCAELVELEPAFIEEPVATLHADATARVRAALPRLPLAGGERLYLRQHFLPYLEKGLFDVVQPDVCLAGGITETRKIAALAESYSVRVQLHNCAGPICTAASLHLMLATPNASPQEWFPFWEDGRYDMVHEPFEPIARDGAFDAAHANRPGLGVELNDDYVQPFLVSELSK
ncbi:MAG: mandelate racemase/muconate lactonizing enzyme family protein [Kiritimatiellae bacterium]|nr:mandelate racemase/muconate lactonizing enzyme family protein [Kiritimatiellia bacterium]MDW8459050.1 mandelate racemase/muconate lactonizing enzyme family protein [Verrucomicrobiota bacterium]